MTVQQIIDAALRKIGARAVGDQTTLDEYQDVLESLNMMLESWATETYTVPMIVDQDLPLPAGAATRTIGPGAQIDTARPLSIYHAHLRTSQGQDQAPLDIIEWEEFQQIPDKAQSGEPRVITYRPTNDVVGTLYFHTVPQEAYTLFLDSLKPFQSFLSPDEDFALPPEYNRAVIYNLAVEIAPDFGESLRADVVAIAHRSKKNVRRLRANALCNKVPLPSGLEVSGSGYEVW